MVTIWIQVGLFVLCFHATIMIRFDNKFPKVPNLKIYQNPPEVCYEIVGCFSNKPPWYSFRRMVFPPRHPSQLPSVMYFHNRQTKNPNGTRFQTFPEIDLSQVDFDVNKPTFVIFHGNGDSPVAPRQLNIAKALLKRVDANIFYPDYSHGRVNYFQSKGDIRVAGRLAALALLKTGIHPSKMHLMGHSLGAHMAAYTANYLDEKKGRVARITGYDPTRPDFEGHDRMVRLDETDADFVDVIHSTAGRKGYLMPNGHVDYYVNGGFRQPGCFKRWMTENIGRTICSHVFSMLVWTKSLEEDGCIVGERVSVKAASFGGIPVNKTLECDEKDCVSMGLGVDKTARGVFYVPTNKPPFICNNKF